MNGWGEDAIAPRGQRGASAGEIDEARSHFAVEMTEKRSLYPILESYCLFLS
jgi:hypothetical protein